jgi:hypothetical protein
MVRPWKDDFAVIMTGTLLPPLPPPWYLSPHLVLGLPCRSERCDGAAMEGRLCGDDDGSLNPVEVRTLPSQLDGALVGLGAGVAEEDLDTEAGGRCVKLA